MNKTLKALALVTTGLVVGVVIKRVGKKKYSYGIQPILIDINRLKSIDLSDTAILKLRKQYS
ncbi:MULTISPECIES: hypothetical protein [unclassified Facklamia]|uniref:hypothetical protein n=1 Tax=Aerococcaceae TaxID=186827 RepID=UPI0013BADE82|nr:MULTISPECIES: hypothetical protein [unclassified Facklamia]NEW64286.1 hypothetical protein [Facklamia sp. 252]NEW67877.1 hypothetical protein [Facklamia sp. 253]QQD64752.1 hypothetical protein JDW14_05280 [Aerococcaceae bacterium zg-252]